MGACIRGGGGKGGGYRDEEPVPMDGGLFHLANGLAQSLCVEGIGSRSGAFLPETLDWLAVLWLVRQGTQGETSQLSLEGCCCTTPPWTTRFGAQSGYVDMLTRRDAGRRWY